MTPEPLWTPPADVRETTRIGRFADWLERTRGLRFDDYAALHRWSVADLDGFWSAVVEHFGITFTTPPRAVLGRREMPGAEWFPGAELNYARHALRNPFHDEVAVVAHSQTRPPVELTWAELRDRVARARAGLVRLGVGRGDRVVAFAPNIPETLIAFLATASLGAVWASCAPEFGARSVVDRFAQVEPVVLLAVPGYVHGGKHVDRRDAVADLRAGLPGLRHVVEIPYGDGAIPDAVGWAELLAGPGPLDFEPVPFAHPLYVLFSSGTTGKPKAIVHGHGGITVEHTKNHALSWDLGPGDRFQWFTTTAWMLWNSLVSGLLVGASVVLVDGNPVHPDPGWQWRLADETGATTMGASPGWLMACRAKGLRPGEELELRRLRQIGVAGSPLPAEAYHWVRGQFGDRVLLNNGSGGTDICTAMVQGSAWQPVWAGEISGPTLGVECAAFDVRGRPVVGELGELVITRPVPSMPVRFWGDAEPTDPASRYHRTYFDAYPGVWRHGDWARFRETGSCVITGRSDATLNRGGVRLGTAEFYAVVEELPEVDDSLVVHLEDPAGGSGELLLFVQLADGAVLDDALRARVADVLRSALSPRHVPDRITAVPAVPRNRTGKKLELPVKKILLGAAVDDVAGRDALADPTSLDVFEELS
ncbi:acetoacetate--CoA ligase [Saccharothrix longispora]|uniref:Acetoacetyl-CoA synthetase n=1 Tax=Saccharothrix longispora TaxID=33920 RepID=A0ABU1PQK6_9PSEU|nr:acetoacetate--CoA ligase [Saccharothrix longispora]MDR6592374.1 acetoacetyl-CoA synthetase [Saccharothrix longispora]